MAKTDLVNPDPEIKARLREQTDKLQMSIRELSEQTGISAGTINNMIYENRPGAIRAEYLKAFWVAFPSLDMQYVLTGKRTGTNDAKLKSILSDIRDLTNEGLGEPPTPTA